MSEVNDFLMGGGVKSATFPEIGATVTGSIVREPELRQQTDLKTGELKFWKDGSPRQQIVVQLATSERDPASPDDDGVRALYIKGNLQKAVRDAIRTSGAKGLEVGGTLTAKFVSEGEVPGKGMSPPKFYSASYVPASTAQVNDFLNAGQSASPAPAPASAPAVPDGLDPAVAAALAKLSPEQLASLGK